MNKFSTTYNHDIDSFKDSVRHYVEECNIDESELPVFLNLKRAISKFLKKDSDELLRYAWQKKDVIKKFKNENDFYFFIASEMIDHREIKKIAYPMDENYFFKTPFFGYDTKLWASCVHKIYDSVYTEGKNYVDALEKYSSNTFKDETERNSFLNWIKYYNHGEHLKYNIKNASIKKDSAFSLIGDPYSSTSNYMGSDYSNLDHDKQVDDIRERGESKINYKNWKKKFNTALRRVDKILKESEDYVDPDKYEEISQVLNKLDVQVGKIRLQVSASDISYRAASQLKKLGFDSGASVLFKYSQEAAPLPAEPERVVEEDATQAAQPTISAGPSQEETNRKMQDRANAEKGKTLMKNISPNPGAEEGEYDSIMKEDVSIEDASRKLEQIAGTLSDRRVIRYLAEFDIILDKVGVASMFPELAEAQSKLIESYSYALTRVTKMLGMLSNSKAIMDMSNNNELKVPGTPDVGPSDKIEPEAVTSNEGLTPAELPEKITQPEG